MANSENQVELKLNLDVSGVQSALYDMIGDFTGTGKEFDKITKRIVDSFKNLEAVIKRFGANSKEAEAAMKSYQKALTSMVANGVDPGAASFTKLSNAVIGSSNAINSSSGNLKKNNMMWTNLALVVQDLPFGFRGIQNNLPALIGGMAGATGAIYLATSAAIALFTAWDMGAFGAKKETDEWAESVKKFNQDLKASLDYSDSSTQRLKGLVAIGNDYTLSEDQRAKAFKAIKDELTKVNKAEGDKIKNMRDATIAVGTYTEAIKAQNIAELTGKRLAELEIQNLKDRAIVAASSGKGIHPLEWFGLSESDAQAASNRINKTVGEIRLLESVQNQALRSNLNNPYSEFNKPADVSAAVKQQQKVNEQILQNKIDAKKQELKLVKDDAQAKYDVGKQLAQLETDLDLERLKNAGYTDQQIASLQLGIYKEYANKLVLLDEDMQNQLLDNAKKAADRKKKILEKEYKDSEKFAQNRVDNVEAQLDTELKIHRKNIDLQRDDIQKAMATLAVMAATSFNPAAISVYLKKFEELGFKLQALPDRAKLFAEEFNSIMSNTLVSGFTEIGAQLGEVFSGGDFKISSILSILADSLIQIGKALILYSALVQSAKKAIESGQFEAAIPLGIAAIAAGTALKNKIKAGDGVQKFANGGIISGPTYGLMGEYPGAKSNPEVVAPLDKLKDMIGGSGGSGTFVLRGQDLLLSINRTQKSSSLKGQNISLI